MTPQKLTLLELQRKIKLVVENSFPTSYWLIAEIGQIHVNQSGHCYLQLIEKENEKIVAKMQATIWASTFRIIKPYFETTTGITLQTGVKILVNVSVNYDEVYALSLNIQDIEPSYTRGVVELKRRQIFQQLMREGIAEMNRQIPLPELPKNIVVISSHKAAGYEDFKNELTHNAFGFQFHIQLFNAMMQGEKTPETIIAALDKILPYETIFDVVVILRGGGAETDISSFDSYELASHVAQFPLPVICAIGHERDETVLDLISSLSLKTPTAAADVFVQKFLAIREEIQSTENFLRQIISSFITNKQQYIQEISMQSVPLILKLVNNKKLYIYQKTKMLETAVKNYCQQQRYSLIDIQKNLHFSTIHHTTQNRQVLDLFSSKLKDSVKLSIKNQEQKLALYFQISKSNNPKNILKKGYSISYLNKKPITNGTALKVGTVIDTTFHKGRKRSKIIADTQN